MVSNKGILHGGLVTLPHTISAQADLSLGPLGRFLRILLTDIGAQASIARNVAKRRKNPSALEYKHLQKRSNISLRGQDAHVPSGCSQSAREIM